jgi:hypothetical protein
MMRMNAVLVATLLLGSASRATAKEVASATGDLKGDGQPTRVAIREMGPPLERSYVVTVMPERATFTLPGNAFTSAQVARIATWLVLVASTADCGGSCSGQYITLVGYAGAPQPRVLWQGSFEKGRSRVKRGGIEVMEGVYGPNDGNCCPSRSKITRYEWRGGTMKKVRERIVGANAPEIKTWNDEYEPTDAPRPTEAQQPSNSCISSAQCPEGLICDFSTRTCVTRQCISSAQCPEGLLCEFSTRTCVIPGTPRAPATVQVKQVKVELRTWGMCLDLYKIDHGSYPTVHEGLLAVLADGKCKALLKDPWGNPYRYILKGGRRGVACSLGAGDKHDGSDENAIICSE